MLRQFSLKSTDVNGEALMLRTKLDYHMSCKATGIGNRERK